MRHIIYKTTNRVNGKYYIGRHSTKNLDDGYLGSGTHISNAIKKYGQESFEREILGEALTTEDLWYLEELFVCKDVVEDPNSYNLAYGGKNHLRSLKENDYVSFLEHQKKAGIEGGKNSPLKKGNEIQKMGGVASAEKRRESLDHPFWDGTAAVAGGKALKGYVELWNPEAVATNKNQPTYRKGDCKRVKPDSELFFELRENGWKTIQEHKSV